jgi:hypothetical protein
MLFGIHVPVMYRSISYIGLTRKIMMPQLSLSDIDFYCVFFIHVQYMFNI